MRKADVIGHFGTVGDTAKALGITSNAVSQWGDIVPTLRQFQIEKATGGKLKATAYKASLQRPRQQS